VAFCGYFRPVVGPLLDEALPLKLLVRRTLLKSSDPEPPSALLLSSGEGPSRPSLGLEGERAAPSSTTRCRRRTPSRRAGACGRGPCRTRAGSCRRPRACRAELRAPRAAGRHEMRERPHEGRGPTGPCAQAAAGAQLQLRPAESAISAHCPGDERALSRPDDLTTAITITMAPTTDPGHGRLLREAARNRERSLRAFGLRKRPHRSRRLSV
jgi:hypothetical protein